MRGVWMLAVLVAVAPGCSGSGGRPDRGSPAARACSGAAAPLEREAGTLRGEGYLDRALIITERALKACPGDRLRRARAELLGELGLVDRAIAAYGQVRGDTRAEVAALRALAPARRDATADELEQAGALFHEGLRLRFAGDFDGAVTQLRRSYALAPHPLTIVQIGQVHKAAGHLVDYRIANARALALAEQAAGARAELRIHQGHRANVHAVAVDPGGRTLVSGGLDATIVWDLTSGRQLRELPGWGLATEVRFSADGSAVYVGHMSELQRFDPGTAALRWRLGRTSLVAMAVGGNRVAAGGFDGSVIVVDAASGTTVREHEVNGELGGIDFSPDGRRLAACARKGDLRVWQTDTGAEVAHWVAGDCRALSFAPDGAQIATGGAGGVQLWHAAGGRLLAIPQPTPVASLAYDATGGQLAAGTDGGEAVVWDLRSGAQVTTLRGHGGEVTAIAFRPGSPQLITGSRDKTVRIWDAGTGAQLRALGGHGAMVNAVAFAPDGGTLAAGSDDHTVKLWDLGPRTAMRVLAGHTDAVTAVAYSDDGLLASSSSDATVRLWPKSGPPTTLAGHARPVRALAWGPRRQLASAAGTDGVILWDVRAGALLRRLPRGDHEDVYTVAFSPDGRRLAVGGADNFRGSVMVHELAGGAVLGPYQGVDGAVLAVTFSPDGRRLAAGSQRFTLWDPADVEPVHSEPTGAAEFLFALAYRGDGGLVISGSDRGLALWDAGGSSLAVVPVPGVVSGVAVAPDDRIAVTSGQDGMVRLWRIDGRELLATLFSDGDRWLVIAPDGRVDASSEEVAADLIYWQVGDSLQLPAFVGWQRNYTPGLLGTLLGAR